MSIDGAFGSTGSIWTGVPSQGRSYFGGGTTMGLVPGPTGPVLWWEGLPSGAVDQMTRVLCARFRRMAIRPRSAAGTARHRGVTCDVGQRPGVLSGAGRRHGRAGGRAGGAVHARRHPVQHLRGVLHWFGGGLQRRPDSARRGDPGQPGPLQRPHRPRRHRLPGRLRQPRQGGALQGAAAAARRPSPPS